MEWLLYAAGASLLVFFIVACLGFTALVAQTLWRLLRGRPLNGRQQD